MPRKKRKRAHGEGTDVYEVTVTDPRSGKKRTRWQTHVTVPGEFNGGIAKRQTIYGKTQAEALANRQALERKIEEGTYSKNNLTVSQYLSLWLENTKPNIQLTTFDEYVYCINTHIVPRIGKERLERLQPLRVERLLREITGAIFESSKGKNAGISTANKCRVVLSTAYNHAIKLGRLKVNPVQAVKPLPSQQRELTLWESEQTLRFLKHMRQERHYVLFLLEVETGLRRGEILGLRWCDVDLAAGRLHIRQTLIKRRSGLEIKPSPKSKAGRRSVPISNTQLEMLMQHREKQRADKVLLGNAWGSELWKDSDLVFTSEVGTPINPDNLKRVYRRIMNKANVPQLRFHDLRHLCASLLMRTGLNDKEVAERMGHSRASFTKDKYTHLFEEQRNAKAIDVFALLGHSPPQGGDLN